MVHFECFRYISALEWIFEWIHNLECNLNLNITFVSLIQSTPPGCKLMKSVKSYNVSCTRHRPSALSSCRLLSSHLEKSFTIIRILIRKSQKSSLTLKHFHVINTTINNKQHIIIAREKKTKLFSRLLWNCNLSLSCCMQFTN